VDLEQDIEKSIVIEEKNKLMVVSVTTEECLHQVNHVIWVPAQYGKQDPGNQ
jgi:hypothetical protein